ncbi:EamA family transporter [Halogeometricum sp. S1BR25-6]|uniref:EamA family transporter n=1 Tax=Halogeometricum salsisoli TaxID=2950536 RepID=A0ABU2GGK2_9EURY|nr:EamA family transporter [Halogeometricum sp. S1BR25-6]MDS0299434.1 EamA family transporter [Halogeometricum sp. S1BR25-6]
MSRYRNLALFVFLAAAWGASFMAIKAGLGTPTDPGGFLETPVLFAAIRYDVAGVLMLGYAVYATDSPLPRGRDEWATVVVGSVLIMAGYHALLFVGETDPAVTSAAAAVIVSLSPILTAGFARAFLPSERLAPAGLVGLLLGLAGVVVLSNPDPNNLLSGGAVAKLLIFGAATVFALGSVLTRRIDADLPIETMEAWTMLGGALLMHVVSVAIGESASDVSWTTDAFLALGYLSVVASAVGFLVYFVLLKRLGAVEINLVSYVAPVFAALTGWAFLGELPTVYTVAGFALIFVGFLLLKRESIRRELPRLRRGLESFGARD